MAELVPSIRSRAVEIVDGRHGYTLEFSNTPAQHAFEYDEEERRLVEVAARAEEMCHIGGRAAAWVAAQGVIS